MAMPPLRNMNADLSEGMTDGKYNKMVVDWDGPGPVNAATLRAREGLSDAWYSRHEEVVKVRPDGQTAHTPNYTYN